MIELKLIKNKNIDLATAIFLSADKLDKKPFRGVECKNNHYFYLNDLFDFILLYRFVAGEKEITVLKINDLS